MPKIIFVAGVHGVGKGTLCEKIESEFSFPHFSASSLIKAVKNAEVDINKVVIDADKNQDYLLTALEQLKVDSDYILIDGHFCLQGSQGIFDVPIATFKGMELIATLLLTDDAYAIHQRLNTRDGESLNESEIGDLQDRECERANEITKTLNVPLMEASIHELDAIKAWLTNFVS